jgi:hypothetical protein
VPARLHPALVLPPFGLRALPASWDGKLCGLGTGYGNTALPWRCSSPVRAGFVYEKLSQQP